MREFVHQLKQNPALEHAAAEPKPVIHRANGELALHPVLEPAHPNKPIHNRVGIVVHVKGHVMLTASGEIGALVQGKVLVRLIKRKHVLELVEAEPKSATHRVNGELVRHRGQVNVLQANGNHKTVATAENELELAPPIANGVLGRHAQAREFVHQLKQNPALEHAAAEPKPVIHRANGELALHLILEPVYPGGSKLNHVEPEVVGHNQELAPPIANGVLGRHVWRIQKNVGWQFTDSVHQAERVVLVLRRIRLPNAQDTPMREKPLSFVPTSCPVLMRPVNARNRQITSWFHT